MSIKEAFSRRQAIRKAKDAQLAKDLKNLCNGSKAGAAAAYTCIGGMCHGTDFLVAKVVTKVGFQTAGKVLTGLGVASLAYNLPSHCRVYNNIMKDD